uniref:Uncharacterized protein n=1 Tax=Cucumis melo TaxID=3656 RepID=A0A9I9D9U7_CUCME
MSTSPLYFRKKSGAMKQRRNQGNRVKASNSVSISSPRVDVEAGKLKEIINYNNVESKILPEEFLSEYPWLKASFMVENDKFHSEGLLRLVRERMPSIGSEDLKIFFSFCFWFILIPYILAHW